MRLLTKDGKPLNLENDPKLPIRAAWLSQGNIWWRVDLLFDELKKHAEEHRKYQKWFKFFKDQLGKTSLMDGPGGLCLDSHVYSPKGRVPDSNAVQDDLVSSQGLVMFFFQSCLVTRSDAHRDFFRTKLENATTRVCQTIDDNQPLEIHLDEGRVPSWFVASTGLVSGFAAWVMNALHLHTSRSMCGLWEDMFREGTLTSSLRDDQEGRVPEEGRVPANVKTPIKDIIVFASMAKDHRTRRQSDKPHPLAKTVLTAILTLHKFLSEFLSLGLEFYVIKDYMAEHDTGLAVKVRKGNVGKRVPIQNTLEIKSIWNLMEAAAKSGTSLRQTLIVKQHDERSDLHGSSLCLGYIFFMLVS